MKWSFSQKELDAYHAEVDWLVKALRIGTLGYKGDVYGLPHFMVLLKKVSALHGLKMDIDAAWLRQRLVSMQFPVEGLPKVCFCHSNGSASPVRIAVFVHPDMILPKDGLKMFLMHEADRFMSFATSFLAGLPYEFCDACEGSGFVLDESRRMKVCCHAEGLGKAQGLKNDLQGVVG